jgi:hypothetical protein
MLSFLPFQIETFREEQGLGDDDDEGDEDDDGCDYKPELYDGHSTGVSTMGAQVCNNTCKNSRTPL